MKHLIVGTCGHIDHGKTTLIKALTGRDTDKLKEEKERGISINLGFTYFDTPSGIRVGIVDVPGHERFLKNMLAGISGIDLVLFIISLEEGVMPQTKEHFQILSLLDVKNGIIVLTKKDMVDEEWADLIETDVREFFKNSFLEDAPSIRVSSKTGEGLEELKKLIDESLKNVEGKDIKSKFRLPIDRVFTIQGHGTIITGTVISGSIKTGEDVEIYPQNIKSKIRSLEVHGEKVEEVVAGERAAINIASVKKEDVQRGNVLSRPNIAESTYMVNCSLKIINDENIIVENRQRIKFYHGTSETVGRVILIDRDELKSDEEGLVQFRLEEPILCLSGDRYIIRQYSPMNLLGGGRVIEPFSDKAKRFSEKLIHELEIKSEGEPDRILLSKINKLSSSFPNFTSLHKEMAILEDDLKKLLKGLVDNGEVIKIQSGNEDLYISLEYYKVFIDKILEVINNNFKTYPLRGGISKEELKSRLGLKIPNKAYENILDNIEEDSEISISLNMVSLKGHKIALNPLQTKIKDDILNFYKDSPAEVPPLDTIFNKYNNEREVNEVLNYLSYENKIVRASPDTILLMDNYEKIKNELLNYIKENKSISIAEWKTLIKAS
ncbi:MAG: selenocysteine-specific translation elongation factor, partial [Oscillospiraceae bacterium]|nr:selenocysteine-specific translation elongation factor [Oscillospiraceae bacterium]